MGYQRRVHGSLLPLSITTNCTMKSLLIFSTLLAVGLSEPEAKAIVAPYNYGIPGYYGGVAAPFAYNNAWTAPLNYAPQTAYPYAPQTAYSYAPMPKLMHLSLHLHLLHLSIMLPLLLHLYLVNLLLGMNSATPNTVIPTGRL